MIQSQAWKESLKSNPQQEDSTITLYASLNDEVLANSTANNLLIDNDFEKQYESLVARAYFKIITEAEKFDARISAEYHLLEDNLVEDNISKRQKEEIKKKYKAHKAMLAGLKSWNIFSEDRSGDLMYFKAENKGDVLNMLNNGDDKNQIVNFLIYKLADLYHVEEN